MAVWLALWLCSSITVQAQCPAGRLETGPVELGFTPAMLEAGGVQFLYHGDPGSTRIILFFHGGGGQAANVFERIEPVRFVRAAVDAGYAVGALDSADRVTRRWSPLPADVNPDIANVRARLADLEDLGVLAPGAAVFGVGVSNGGAFVSRLSQAVPLSAMAIHHARGIDPVFEAETPPPTFFVSGENDTTVPAAETGENAARMSARDLPYHFIVATARPVSADSFIRIPGIDLALSTAIRNGLATAGLLDACGLQTASPSVSGWQGALPPEAAPLEPAIEDQLRVLYADHEFESDYAERQLEFFGFPFCGQEPRRSCRESLDPASGSLSVRTGGTAERTKLAWRWRKGPAIAGADLGDPVNATEFGVCLFDGADTLQPLARLRAPAGGTCGPRGRACWSVSARPEVKYVDGERTPDGLRKLRARGGGDGESRLVVSGRGANLRLSPPPFVPPVTMQVVTSDGGCWGATYDDSSRITRNDASGFKGRGSAPTVP